MYNKYSCLYNPVGMYNILFTMTQQIINNWDNEWCLLYAEMDNYYTDRKYVSTKFRR